MVLVFQHHFLLVYHGNCNLHINTLTSIRILTPCSLNSYYFNLWPCGIGPTMWTRTHLCQYTQPWSKVVRWESLDSSSSVLIIVLHFLATELSKLSLPQFLFSEMYDYMVYCEKLRTKYGNAWLLVIIKRVYNSKIISYHGLEWVFPI